MIEFYLTKLLTGLALPPGCIFVLFLLGLALRRRWLWLGRGLMICSGLLFYVLSLAPTALTLVRGLQVYPPLIDTSTVRAQAGAIVVLQAGSAYRPEFDGPDVSLSSLGRIRYAAWLQRGTDLPLLVTGNVYGAPVMRRILEGEYDVPVQWLDARSLHTADSGRNVAQLLGEQGIDAIALVTSSLHMSRAVRVFKARGFKVFPAPTLALGPPPQDQAPSVYQLLPSASALALSRSALYEYAGLAWYRIRYSSPPSN